MQLVNRLYTPLLFLLFVLASCGPSNKVTFSWNDKNFKADKSYKKIFTAALVTNPHVRTHLEEEMSKASLALGFSVERSWDYFPPTFSQGKPIDKEIMMGKIKELNCDLIFTITLVDKESETRYIPGMSGIYGPYAGYGMGFRGYYSYWYPYIYDPGYYVTDKRYFMEGNLFDTVSDKLIWSVQTESLNPSSMEKFSKEIVSVMFEKAIKDLNLKSQQ